MLKQEPGVRQFIQDANIYDRLMINYIHGQQPVLVISDGTVVPLSKMPPRQIHAILQRKGFRPKSYVRLTLEALRHRLRRGDLRSLITGRPPPPPHDSFEEFATRLMQTA